MLCAIVIDWIVQCDAWLSVYLCGDKYDYKFIMLIEMYATKHDICLVMQLNLLLIKLLVIIFDEICNTRTIAFIFQILFPLCIMKNIL
jgi:hypothetical protein